MPEAEAPAETQKARTQEARTQEARTEEAPPDQKGVSNLAVRAMTAAVGVPILLWMMYWAPPVVFVGVGIFASFLSGYELFSMTLPERPYARAYGILATMAFTATVLFAPDTRTLLTASIALAGAGALVAIAGLEDVQKGGWEMGWLVGGPFYMGGMVALIAKPILFENGGSWILLAMALAWGSDTGGYFAGRFLGKRFPAKLAPLISPKKTVVGSIGGLVTITLAALAITHLWLPEVPPLDAVILALVAGALGQMGDLCISLIKRSTGVKDSGKIIPGHGGLLDRIDALFFTASGCYLYAAWFVEPNIRPLW